MNKKALIIGLVYCAVVIAFKLYILLGGYTFTRFGFYYTNIIANLLIIPFYFFAIYYIRKHDYQGSLRGRESGRLCLTILAVSIVVLSAYNYVEVEWKFRDLAKEYYHSAEYLAILQEQQSKHPDKIKTEDFPKIIEDQISGLSAFKATTGKLIPMLFFGLSGAFIASVLMKGPPRQNAGPGPGAMLDQPL